MTLFAEVALLFVLAAGVSFVFQALRLPTIVGYLLIGLGFGPFALGVFQSTESFELLAQIGMCALLFSVGLHVNGKALRELGKTVLKMGLIQILLNLTLGILIGRSIGFNWMMAGLLGAALSFNSTVLALRSLGERGDLGRAHGKITTGILLLQDVFAIIVLLLVSVVPLGGSEEIAFVLGKGIGLIALVILFSQTLLPRLVARAAKSQELLAIGSLGLALGLAALFHLIGWSLEIGALLAGICLANTAYRFEIEAKLKPVRELFLVVFFVLLGTQIDPVALRLGWGVAAILSVIVLVVNPWVIGQLMRRAGQAREPSFLVAVHLAHLSEFSLLLLFVASHSMSLPPVFVSSITITAMVTMIVGSIYMNQADPLRRLIERFKGPDKHKNSRYRTEKDQPYEVILFGCHRVGGDFLPALKKMHANYLVVDFDPEAIAAMEEHGIPCRYGDAEDEEFLRELEIGKAKLVISTIPNPQTNANILRLRKKNRVPGVTVLVAHSVEAALLLYRQGATYVILPHVLGGNYASQLIEANGLKKGAFVAERNRHIAHLKNRGAYVAATPMLSHGRWN